MSESLLEEPNRELSLGAGACLQRRIRHITSIQVRNLTPFPARDAFASALSQPSEQPQFTSHGHLSDDLDVTFGRKRSRRISAGSVNTMRSRTSEDGVKVEELRGVSVGSPDLRARVGGSPRVSFLSEASQGSTTNVGSSSRALPSTGTPSIRSSNRPRTSSMASSINILFAQTSSVIPSSSTISVPFFPLLPDNSQKALEKVINSRLVETFISITVPPSLSHSNTSAEHPSDSPPTSPSPSRSGPHSHTTSPEREKKTYLTHQKTASAGSSTRKVVRPPAPTTVIATTVTRRDSTRATKFVAPAGSTYSPRSNGKVHKTSPSISSQRFPAPALDLRPTTGATRPLPLPSPIPNYLSPIHRPSTNPSFAVDARSGNELASWTDLSSEKLRVEVWGRLGSSWAGVDGALKGKGEENGHLGDGEDWKVLEEWNINLADLVPLSDDLSSHPSHLPSNTLTLTLAPHGQSYYLPPSVGRSRPPSPSAGYSSEPESSKDGRTVSIVRELVDMQEADTLPQTRETWRSGTVSRESRVISKTAGWQDLLKLVTLQSCILDMETSLSDIIGTIDSTLQGDVSSTLKREALERECLVKELHRHCDQVKHECDEFTARIATRRELLHIRKQTLAEAREYLTDNLSRESQVEADVVDERTRLSTLRLRLPPIRTTLIATLAAIFPIELISPPDLLFTILSVPLPIPLSSTDPAPPLSLLNHKEVTEDAVATALGYAAHVVHLLSAYLSKGLVYPITCVGSRSLIRDGISAMVGPRMFPLFSKGVDTYRFEYGVFLLNKDIEMLMADRDLRALDMRHTLPNLKNLLLTLTDGEGIRLNTPRLLNSPTGSTSGLESPRAKSPAPLEPTTSTSSEPDGEGGTSSGTTTPIATTSSDDRKSHSILGFYPLAGFLRSRYPSVVRRPSIKSVSETPDSAENGDASTSGITHRDGRGEDDEDRRTIRAVSREREPEQKAKSITSGGAINDAALRGPREKSSHETLSSVDPSIIVSDVG